MSKILIIEDDVVVQLFLRSVLEKEKYECLESTSGEDGLAKAAQCAPDVVLLDLGLPDMDGIDLVARLRNWMQVPIIVLSSRGEESSKVAALDAGADDYLTKPIGIAELQARLRVALRHASHAGRTGQMPGEEAVFHNRSLRVDLAQRQVWAQDREVRLTPIEYKLLAHLVRNAGKVVRHRDLLQAVWGSEYSTEVNYLRIYIKHLRHKIEPLPAAPRFILNEPGVGYRFATE